MQVANEEVHAGFNSRIWFGDEIAKRFKRELERAGQVFQLPASVLLRALGMSAEEILNYFYGQVVYTLGKNGWETDFDAERLRGQKLISDLVDAKTGKVKVPAGTMRANIRLLSFPEPTITVLVSAPSAEYLLTYIDFRYPESFNASRMSNPPSGRGIT